MILVLSHTSRKKKSLGRRARFRDARLIVIATEGTFTEKQYFSRFESSKVKVEVLETVQDKSSKFYGCSSPKQVIDRLNEYKKEYDIRSEEDGQLWLMLDTDNWKTNLTQTANEASQKKYRLAISNPCFELWIYLHFHQIDNAQAFSCREIEKLLKEMPHGYNKTKLRLDLFTEQNIKDAIDRAIELDQSPANRWPQRLGTHVYKVVQEIISLIGKTTL